MKKQLILAAISVALMATPFVDSAAKSTSGFSSSKSSASSGFKASSGSASSSSSSSKASSSSYSAPARTYAPSNQVTPRSAQLAPTPAPAQPKSGFTSTTSSTKKTLVGAAGATALGGALYAAGANHAAVAAYEQSQRPAPAPVTPSPAAEHRASSPSMSGDFDTRSAASPAYHQAPQVIVVRDAPSYHVGRDDYVDAYRDGVRDAQRHAPIYTPPVIYAPGMQSAPRAQMSQSSPLAPAANESTNWGATFLWIVAGLMVLGAMGYFITMVLGYGKPKSSASSAGRKSNYTL